jgi:hypothetical protein
MEPKKRSMGASERNEEARSAFRERVKPLDPRKLIFSGGRPQSGLDRLRESASLAYD